MLMNFECIGQLLMLFNVLREIEITRTACL
jgi:hypothetical protein